MAENFPRGEGQSSQLCLQICCLFQRRVADIMRSHMSDIMRGCVYLGTLNPLSLSVQRSAKRWALGCVNSPSAARGSEEAGFTQPRPHLLADPCRSRRSPPLSSRSYPAVPLSILNLASINRIANKFGGKKKGREIISSPLLQLP